MPALAVRLSSSVVALLLGLDALRQHLDRVLGVETRVQQRLEVAGLEGQLGEAVRDRFHRAARIPARARG